LVKTVTIISFGSIRFEHHMNVNRVITCLMRIMSRALIFVVMSSWTITSNATDKIGEADKKEIARILFDQVLSKSEISKKETILLDPNTNLSLIPNIEGLSFRKLKYEERSQVDEYFRLDLNESKGKIEAALLRGNRCLLSGDKYRFKRKANDWQPELVGYTQSRPTQQPCPGCKLFVDPSKHTYLRDQVPKRNIQQSLIISGEVEHLECVPEKEVIQCNVKVLLHFTNHGKQPVIILKPYGEYSYDIGGASLSPSPTGQNFYDIQMWRSVSISPEYQRLGNMIDSSTPPSDITVIIKPGQSWNWKTERTIRFNQENTCDPQLPDGVEIGWKEVKKLHSPLWMRLYLEMWPFNVENFKKNLGKKLKKRWAPYGEFMGAQAGRYWFAHLETEPILVDMSEIY
jgi:hypothetical protein